MDSDNLTIEEDMVLGFEALFERCPELCGFTVQEFSPNLVVNDLSIYPDIDAEHRETIAKAIAETLFELASFQPAVKDLLRGRTIARALH